MDVAEFRQLEAFIYREAQLADESRYDEWEKLLADDMQYWVPGGDDSADPDFAVSIINDNRSRLATRLRQLKTGTRHSQVPKSRMRRMISNIAAEKTGEGEYKVEANFVVYEYQMQSTHQINVWPGRVEYRLRQVAGELKMSLKKIMLIHAGGNVPTLSFLI
jgi:3-phenylpropionate/cinnamic acid dioxygenase small subunit